MNGKPHQLGGGRASRGKTTLDAMLYLDGSMGGKIWGARQLVLQAYNWFTVL